VNTSGAAFDSFNVAAERLTGRSGDKPFCTWYDDHRDERVELSYRTFGNWVAKTANLLVDELGAEPGDQVEVLAEHWQVPVVLAACWRAGLGVVSLEPGGPAPRLVAAFVDEERLADAPVPEATPVVALTADPLGRAGRDLGRARPAGPGPRGWPPWPSTAARPRRRPCAPGRSGRPPSRPVARP
jgi:uncharacterized protein (TIGR03089 family)